MKKTIFALILAAVFAVSVFAQSGKVSDMYGTVELKPAGASAFVPAKPGDAVSKDTVVSTGYKSGATLVVGSSTIQVKALTRLSLAELAQEQNVEKINVSLQAGRVRVDVKPPAGTKTDFTVKSPSATASVRGTGFDFDTKNLSVSNGTVAYAGTRGASILVSAGSDSYADAATGKAADPIETGAAALLPPPPPGSDAAVSAPSSATQQAVEYSMTFSWQ
jgi:hypothetical protein